METTEVTVPMYYGMTIEDLVLDPAARGAPTAETVLELDDYSRDEQVRVMTMAVMLYHKQTGILTMGECLCTAMIWERG